MPCTQITSFFFPCTPYSTLALPGVILRSSNLEEAVNIAGMDKKKKKKTRTFRTFLMRKTKIGGEAF